MPYVRISVAKPRKGEEARVEEIFKRINTEAAKNDGCLETFLLHPHDESGEVARMAIYSDEHTAEAAASNDTVLALRSEMHLLVEPGHEERAFFSAH